MKKLFFLISLVGSSFILHAQQDSSSTSISPLLAKAFEKPSPEEEIARLSSKKDALTVRLSELESDPSGHEEEIARIKGMIRYIDGKVESLQKYLNSVEYAEQSGLPEQGTMSDEEYRAKKLEWYEKQKTQTNGQQENIKTTLTREEFERLPKERQERILSMPERYVILD